MTIEGLSKGDRPFLPTSKGRTLPDMGWARYIGNVDDLYVNGYRRAAELLQAEVVKTGSKQLGFPLLFMWRQHVEVYPSSVRTNGIAVFCLLGSYSKQGVEVAIFDLFSKRQRQMRGEVPER